MRLAMYVDQVFWRDGGAVSTDESFILFPASFAEAGERVSFIGRAAPKPGRAPYVLGHEAITFEPLPYYPSLWDFRNFLASLPQIYTRIRSLVRRHARQWDAMLIDGPHPIGQMIARECAAIGLPVALMVRQNLIEQMRGQQGVLRGAAVEAARLLEWDFRRLARGRTVFAVGGEISAQYASYSDRVHDYFPCLIDDAQFRQLRQLAASEREPDRLLVVGRLSSEKGHPLLLEALKILRDDGVMCRLDIAGSGAMEAALKTQTRDLGLEEQVTFHGYVTYGPDLFDLYRRAGAMVLPSLTEGFPQVINEALCVGLPTIATKVGGIPTFLSDRQTAMLVPPGDAPALAAAIRETVTDAPMRRRLSANGIALMERNTLEVHRARVIGALKNEVIKA